jgi:hypothetical protein
MGTQLVLDPVATRPTGSLPAAARPGIARGAVFGVISNSKPNASNLLHAVSRRLQDRHGLIEGFFFQKSDIGGWGHPLPAEWIDQLASGTVAVLAASGD